MPTLSYQQLGRPPSRHDIPSQNPMDPHQSPALAAGQIPPRQDRSYFDNALDNELASYPPDVIGDAKRHIGLSDRDPQSLTTEEKLNILNYAAILRQNPPNGGLAGSSGVNIHGQLPNRGPMAQPMQAQLSMPQRGKRNSTSPGEQQQPQLQQQPPMAPMGPFPSGPQPGSVRGPQPMTGGQPPPNGFGGTPMHQIVGPGPMTPMHAMSSGMDLACDAFERMGLYEVVPMPPPGQPGMSGPPKPGGKEGEGELHAPMNPAASAPTSGPLHNSAPPMNPQRPPTSNAPMPTPAPPPAPAPAPGPWSPIGDLSFDMTDMFGSNGGEFDFGPSSLDNMDLWFESTSTAAQPYMKDPSI